MTDIDQRLIDYVNDPAWRKTGYSEFLPGLQEIIDQLVEERTADLQEDLQAKRTGVSNITLQLGKSRKENEILRKALVKEVRFSQQSVQALRYVTDSKNIIVRALAKLIRWPDPEDDYEREQYNSVMEIFAEMKFQDAKWGPNRQQPNGTGSDEQKAKSRLSRARTDEAFANGTGTWEHILTEEVDEAFAEHNPRHLKEELTQVGAVAANWKAALMVKARKGILR